MNNDGDLIRLAFIAGAAAGAVAGSIFGLFLASLIVAASR